MYLLYLISSSGPDLAQVRSGQAWSVESSQVRLKIVQCSASLSKLLVLITIVLVSRVRVAGLALTINEFYAAMTLTLKILVSVQILKCIL